MDINLKEKIFDINDLSSESVDFKKTFEGLSDKILTFGHFSSIHPGHIRYLQYAKSLGKTLIVAIRGDFKNSSKPRYRFCIQSRAESLIILKICDYVIKLEEDRLKDAVQVLKPSTLVLGTEFKNQENQDINEAISKVKSQGKQVIFHAGETQYASTELLGESETNIEKERKEQFLNACNKQKVDYKKLINKIKHFKDCKLLVIGETIVDQYTACEALGMSAEAPVLVVKELKDKIFMGGAAVVAAHVNALGAKCIFVSVVGDDSNGKLVKKEITNLGIKSDLVIDKSRPTTFKKRYMVENQKLFRVSRVEEHELNKDIEEKVLNKISDHIKDVDGIIISDFAYGLITKRINKKIVELSKKYSVNIYADLQCSSQIGSITKFRDVRLICPNEREARLALQDKNSGLEKLANILIDKCQCNNLVMKLNSQGFISYEKDRNNIILNQHFPALCVNPLDVTGAGDSLLAIMSICLSIDNNIMEASALGCFMTALAVENLGNKPISNTDLKAKIKDYLLD